MVLEAGLYTYVLACTTEMQLTEVIDVFACAFFALWEPVADRPDNL